MTQPVDLTNCDREPIHIPGAIQPHGVMLVIDPRSMRVGHAAGDVAGRLGVETWIGRPLSDLVGEARAAQVAVMATPSAPTGFVGQVLAPSGECFDLSAHRSGAWLVAELEPGPREPALASAVLGRLAASVHGFERITTVRLLCERAAAEFRALTGFDRVMIYHFLDDTAGAVLGEDKVEALPSFLNHRFPGSDIPRQARALYVRNPVRVIPDVRYSPAPIEPAWTDAAPLDMSDCVLRSVSPVHMQYMQNMGVEASASISIVKDGVLWGLVACHHRTPRGLTFETRAACAALADSLARQIRAKEDADFYRERIRLRSFEDSLVETLASGPSLDAALSSHIQELAETLPSDGAATLRGETVQLHGRTPSVADVKRLAAWLVEEGGGEAVVSDTLSQRFAAASAYRDTASGLLAIVVATDEPFVLMWFRAEKVEVVNWAGNPHKTVGLKDGETLSPRASFEAWSETVRGRSESWTLPEMEAAARLKHAILDLRQHQRLAELNRALTESIGAKDRLLDQKGYLLREVNHRVQNSLQLVSGFLGLQSRLMDNPEAQASFNEAQRRISAVALVHRRLYRSDQIEIIDMARYLDELVADMLESMDAGWADQLKLDLAPVMVATDRAVIIGLVLTELVINANKYAYGGGAGPIEISLTHHQNQLRLIVADQGRGKQGEGSGFGAKMMRAMVEQLNGEIEHLDNGPGLRTVLSAPILVSAPSGAPA